MLTGHLQGIKNPETLATQKAYQRNYRKEHRKEQRLADRRYHQKIASKYGGYNAHTSYLLAASNQSKNISNRKEVYGAIEKHFDPKGRGVGLKKLLQLSINFGARREKDSQCTWGDSASTAKRTMDLLKMSKIKRGAGKGQKANGRKVGGKVSIAKDLH